MPTLRDCFSRAYHSLDLLAIRTGNLDTGTTVGSQVPVGAGKGGSVDAGGKRVRHEGAGASVQVTAIVGRGTLDDFGAQVSGKDKSRGGEEEREELHVDRVR